MLLKFLKGLTADEIIQDVLKYEYGFEIYGDFIKSQDIETIFSFHTKCMNYYNTSNVENREQWIKSKVKFKGLEEEFENLKSLLGAATEESRVLGLNLAWNLFGFSKDEIGYLMMFYFYTEIKSLGGNDTLFTWTLNGYRITSLYRSGYYEIVLHKPKKKNTLTKSTILDDKRHIPKLLNYFIFNT